MHLSAGMKALHQLSVLIDTGSFSTGWAISNPNPQAEMPLVTAAGALEIV